jgi:CRISPR-associated protein Cmr2
VLDRQAAQGVEQHKKFSAALTRFAEDAHRIVSEHQGAAIYAGGDDVLALLPLHTLLDCAAALEDAFREQMRDYGAPGLSAGVAIVHHLLPLGMALDLARAAEKQAKTYDDKKNALAIIVSKRSGGDTTIRGRWKDLHGQLQHFIMQIADIPAGAAYELRDLAARLELPRAEQDDTFREMIRVEAQRIVQRKRLADGQSIRQDLQEHLVKRVSGDDAIVALQALSDELVVARLLATAQQFVPEKAEVQA